MRWPNSVRRLFFFQRVMVETAILPDKKVVALHEPVQIDNEKPWGDHPVHVDVDPQAPPPLDAQEGVLLPGRTFQRRVSNVAVTQEHLNEGAFGHLPLHGMPEVSGVEVVHKDKLEERNAQGPHMEDEFVVKWDGPDDQDRVLNWSMPFRIYQMTLAAALTLCTSFTSSVPSNIAFQMTEEFNTTINVTKAAIFMYVAGFCFAPLVWAPLSEMYGRRIVFIVSFAGFVCFNVGCMLAPNVGAMIVFRIFAGAFSSSSLTNSPAMIASLFSIRYLMRGIAVFSLGPIVGPCIGPIVSGYIVTAGANWRWVFRVSTIFSFVMLVLVVLTMPETHDGLRLKKKARRLRHETGDDRYKAPIEMRHVELTKMVGNVLGKPLKIFFTEPMLILVTIYMSFVYGTLYLFFVAYPIVFELMHGLSSGAEGLMFLGFSVGSFIGAIYCIFVDQRMYENKRQRHGSDLAPEVRLYTCMIAAPLLTISLFWFAWTSYPSISFWSPLVAGGMFGTATLFIFLSLLTYITEVYLANAASAIAANTVVRSAFGAGFPMFGQQMYETLKPRWATCVLAFIALAMFPIPFVFYRYGHVIRSWSKNALSEL